MLSLFSYLIELIKKEEEDKNAKTIGFNTQEEYDDFVASNPPPRSYCLECGDDYEWFMHNCDSSSYNEEYGCSKCDDYCAFGRS